MSIAEANSSGRFNATPSSTPASSPASSLHRSSPDTVFSTHSSPVSVSNPSSIPPASLKRGRLSVDNDLERPSQKRQVFCSHPYLNVFHKTYNDCLVYDIVCLFKKHDKRNKICVNLPDRHAFSKLINMYTNYQLTEFMNHLRNEKTAFTYSQTEDAINLIRKCSRSRRNKQRNKYNHKAPHKVDLDSSSASDKSYSKNVPRSVQTRLYNCESNSPDFHDKTFGKLKQSENGEMDRKIPYAEAAKTPPTSFKKTTVSVNTPLISQKTPPPLVKTPLAPVKTPQTLIHAAANTEQQSTENILKEVRDLCRFLCVRVTKLESQLETDEKIKAVPVQQSQSPILNDTVYHSSQTAKGKATQQPEVTKLNVSQSQISQVPSFFSSVEDCPVDDAKELSTGKRKTLNQRLKDSHNVQPKARRTKKFMTTVCQVCGEEFRKSTALLRHIYEHILSPTCESQVSNIEESMRFICPYCPKKTFCDKAKFLSHLGSHENVHILPKDLVRAASRVQYDATDRIEPGLLTSMVNENIRPEQFNCMDDPTKWLPDFVINEWFKTVVCKNRPDIVYVNPLLTDQFLKFGLDPDTINSHLVPLGASWHGLFLPVLINSHWVLFSYRQKERALICFDPLHNNNLGDSVIQKVKNLIKRYIPGGRGLEYFHYSRSHERQTDGHSCGDLICLFALRMANHEETTLNFSHSLLRGYLKDALQSGIIDPRLTFKWRNLGNRLALKLQATESSSAQEIADMFGHNQNQVTALKHRTPKLREDWVRLYDNNKKMALSMLQCKVDEGFAISNDDAKIYFDERASSTDVIIPEIDRSLFPESSKDHSIELTHPITMEELNAALKQTKNNSAPGPDGLRLQDILNLDPKKETMLLLFNRVLESNELPSQWKEVYIRMIPKKEKVNSIQDMRPIALNNVLYKIFSTIINSRLSDGISRTRFLSDTQKGFTQREGVLEHGFTVDSMLLRAHRGEEDISLAFIDFSDAFGSVSLDLINKALVSAGLDCASQQLINSIVHNNTAKMLTTDGLSDSFQIMRGVRQGDPLSPLLFNMCLELVTRDFQHRSQNHAFLAYADDVVVFTHPSQMQNALITFADISNAFGLQINQKKSATLTIVQGEVDKKMVIVNGNMFPALGKGEIIKYLGGDKNSVHHCSLLSKATDVVKTCHKLKDSLLAPWQKLDALQTFLIPRFTHHLRVQANDYQVLEELEDCITRVTRTIINVPDSCNKHYLYGLKSSGCLGIKCITDEALIHTVAYAYRLLTSTDPVFREKVLESLKGEMLQAGFHTFDGSSITQFLNAPCQLFKASSISPWSRVKGVHDGIQKMIPDYSFRVSIDYHPTIAVSLNHSLQDRNSISRDLRDLFQRKYTNMLHTSYPSQGKFQKALNKDKVSWSFIHNGRHTSYSSYKWIHRARNNLLPVRANPMITKNNGGNHFCRRCTRPDDVRKQGETLGHVLCACPARLGKDIVQRHNSIIDRILRAIHKNPDLKYTVDEKVPNSGSNKRPDIVIRNDNKKQAFIIDVACPMEGENECLSVARQKKIQKYQPEGAALRSEGYNVSINAIVVGALGTWDPENDQVLTSLGIPLSYLKNMKHFIVIDTINASKEIYYRHIYGNKFRNPEARHNAYSDRIH